jgi:NAD+ synthase
MGDYLQNFDAEKVKNDCVKWIKNYFDKEENKNSKCIVALTGGVTSTVVAALCKEALGFDRVIGVGFEERVGDRYIMPQMIATMLGIQAIEVEGEMVERDLIRNMEWMFKFNQERNTKYGFKDEFYLDSMTDEMKAEIKPNLLLTVEKIIAKGCNGRIVNISNYTENWLGKLSVCDNEYGDIAPMAKLTLSEVKKLAENMKLYRNLDMITTSDEDRIGYDYKIVDEYIHTGQIESDTVKAELDKEHLSSKWNKNTLSWFEPTV